MESERFISLNGLNVLIDRRDPISHKSHIVRAFENGRDEEKRAWGFMGLDLDDILQAATTGYIGDPTNKDEYLDLILRGSHANPLARIVRRAQSKALSRSQNLGRLISKGPLLTLVDWTAADHFDFGDEFDPSAAEEVRIGSLEVHHLIGLEPLSQIGFDGLEQMQNEVLAHYRNEFPNLFQN